MRRNLKKLTTNDVKSMIKDKFGDKIELIEEYKNSFSLKHKLFCHEKDPITGKEHGKFKKKLTDLFKDYCHGCQECSNLFNKGKWKFTFFDDLKKIYPNQNFKFLGVEDKSIDFPRGKFDKLLFMCEDCKNMFSFTADKLLNHKPRYNNPNIEGGLLMCPVCNRNRPRKNTSEECLKAAKQCKSRGEFGKKFPGLYESARKYGFLEQYDWLKTPEKIYKNLDENNRSYYVYSYDFSPLSDDKEIYIGLSDSEGQNREYGHRVLRISSRTGKDISSPVRKIALKYGLNLSKKEELNYKKILEDNLTAQEAQEKEDYYVSYYKNSGYKILNKARTGIGSSSLGGAIKKWDSIEKCMEAVKIYREEGHSFQEAESHLNAPIKLLRKANKLDDAWPDRGQHEKYTLDDIRNKCIDLKDKYSSSLKNSEEYKKLIGYAAHMRSGIKKDKVLKILWNELNYLPNNKSNGILEFDQNFNLISIYSDLNHAGKELNMSRGTLSDWVKQRYNTRNSDNSNIYIKEIEFLTNHIKNFSDEDKENFKKKYLELGGMWYKESYN